MPKLVIAKHSSGRMIDIKDADNGLKCDCTCSCCGERLVARQGSISWSFSHESGSECAGAIETALHQAAKQILLEEKMLFVGAYNPFANTAYPENLFEYYPHFRQTIHDDPVSVYEYFAGKDIANKVWGAYKKCQIERLTFTETFSEVQATNSTRIPDVTASLDDKPLYIEIVVTHECDADKRADLKRLGIPVIEIDISSLRKIDFTLSDVRTLLLNDGMFHSAIAYRKWLVLPEYIQNADKLIQEFISAAKIKLEEKRKEEEARKIAISSRVEKLYFLRTAFVINQRDTWASVWIPTVDKQTFSEISSVMHKFHATRRLSDWKLPGTNVVEKLTEAFKNKELEIRIKQEARVKQLKEMQRIKLTQENIGKDYPLKIELGRASESAENSAAKAKEKQDFIIGMKEQAEANAKREKITEQIIERHKHIPNYHWRMKKINEDLNAFGYPPLTN